MMEYTVEDQLLHTGFELKSGVVDNDVVAEGSASNLTAVQTMAQHLALD